MTFVFHRLPPLKRSVAPRRKLPMLLKEMPLTKDAYCRLGSASLQPEVAGTRHEKLPRSTPEMLNNVLFFVFARV